LLKGYRATSHWAYRQHLPLFGATIDVSRVSRDRNRITGGGVTAGIDFGLAVIAAVRGEAEAKEIQLFLEYAPAPPFDCGGPENAPADMIARVRQRLAAGVANLAGATA